MVRTRVEYADEQITVYRTPCPYACLYCWAWRIPLFSSRVQRGKYDPVEEAKKLARRKKPLKIVVSFTSDPYPPQEAMLRKTRKVLEVLKDSRHTVMILTKNPILVHKLDLDFILDHRERFVVGTTVISTAKTYLEPRAPPPEERMEALKLFHNAGVRTWLSIEPIIPGVTDVGEIVKKTIKYVDYYVLGAYNYHKQLRKQTGIVLTDEELREFYREEIPSVTFILEQAGKEYLIKEELRKLLL